MNISPVYEGLFLELLEGVLPAPVGQSSQSYVSKDTRHSRHSTASCMTRLFWNDNCHSAHALPSELCKRWCVPVRYMM
jgi:hypothetical protein